MSVILPVFNDQAHLEVLLSSLLEQTESSLEIIAVDDGSTDDSTAILDSVARRDSRLRVIHQSNQGPATARNAALPHARGRWIAFADSDDWVAPDWLSTWVKRAEAQQLDVVIGNGFHFSRRPQPQRATLLLKRQAWDQVTSGEEWIIRCAAREWPHQAWLQLIRHDFLRDADLRFIDGLTHEDILWTLQLGLAAKRVGFIAAPLYGHRQNPNSLTHDSSESAIRHRILSYLHIVPQLASASVHSTSPRLRYALLHHAHYESAKCFALLRKHLRQRRTRGEMAAAIVSSQLPRIIFQGATNGREIWDALRDVACCVWYSLASGVAFRRASLSPSLAPKQALPERRGRQS